MVTKISKTYLQVRCTRYLRDLWQFQMLQVLYSKSNYIYLVLSYLVDFKAPRELRALESIEYLAKFTDLEGIVNATA